MCNVTDKKQQMLSTSCIKGSENCCYSSSPNSFAPRILILAFTSCLQANLSTISTKDRSKRHNQIKNQVLGSVLFYSASDPGAIYITSIDFGLCHCYMYISLVFARVNKNEQSKNSTSAVPFVKRAERKVPRYIITFCFQQHKIYGKKEQICM